MRVGDLLEDLKKYLDHYLDLSSPDIENVDRFFGSLELAWQITKIKILTTMILLKVVSATIFAAFIMTLEGFADEKPLLLYRSGNLRVEMRAKDEYAVMLVNDGGEFKASPRYILAIEKSRTVLDTKDYELFKLALSSLPEGTKVYEYGSAGVPRSWGLKKRNFNEWKMAFLKNRIIISEDKRVTSYNGKKF